MKLMISAAVVLVFATFAARAMEGGELGNAFVPFDSKIGKYSLEYSKNWRLNDLSVTTSFSEAKPSSAASSFFEVEVSSGGAQSLGELGVRLMTEHPGVAWSHTTVGGLTGLTSTEKGVRLIHLLRAPGDELSLRLRSTDGQQSDEVLSHMLDSFRAE